MNATQELKALLTEEIKQTLKRYAALTTPTVLIGGSKKQRDQQALFLATEKNKALKKFDGNETVSNSDMLYIDDLKSLNDNEQKQLEEAVNQGAQIVAGTQNELFALLREKQISSSFFTLLSAHPVELVTL